VYIAIQLVLSGDFVSGSAPSTFTARPKSSRGKLATLFGAISALIVSHFPSATAFSVRTVHEPMIGCKTVRKPSAANGFVIRNSAPASLAALRMSSDDSDMTKPNFNLLSSLLQPLQQLQSVHLGHVPIAKYEVDRRRLKCLERFRSTAGLLDFNVVTSQAEGPAHDHTHWFTVINDEDMHYRALF
jgi:hypothetical protein